MPGFEGVDSAGASGGGRWRGGMPLRKGVRRRALRAQIPGALGQTPFEWPEADRLPQTRQVILYLLTYPDYDTINGALAEMANLQQSFQYEQSVIPLADGTYFQPLREGVDRWVAQSESLYRAAPGRMFQVLYELADKTFISS